MESSGDINSETCFIFNPASNSGRLSSSETAIRTLVNTHLPEASFICSQPNRSFWRKLPQRLSRCTRLIACGGDGTVHHTGNVAVNIGAALGIIPIGSGNDFAHLMGIPRSIPTAFKKILSNKIRLVDLIKVEGDLNCYCLNTAGIGLDGQANHYTNIYKKRMGKAGYIAGALRAITSAESIQMEIEIDGKKAERSLLMATICNGKREGGNFWVAPGACPDDGLADLLLLEPTPIQKILLDPPSILTSGNFKRIHASRERCRSIDVTCNSPTFIHVDGEYSDYPIHHCTFSVQPSALTVIA